MPLGTDSYTTFFVFSCIVQVAPCSTELPPFCSILKQPIEGKRPHLLSTSFFKSFDARFDDRLD